MLSLKSLFLMTGDGGRGVQEAKRVSSWFQFIFFLTFHGRAHFFDTVSIPPGNGIRRNIKELSDLIKRMAVPDLQYNNFSLFRRKLR